MTTGRKQRAGYWFEWGILSFCILVFCIHTMPRAWKSVNTDFPNYYLSARLAREGFDTSRIYEWTWLQREKDHRNLDIKVIGLLPITPFSTLVMWPLTGISVLDAKHLWILFNLALLWPLCWILRLLTGLPWRRVALIFALSFPLHFNMVYGQFYLFLLFLIVAACWAYLKDYQLLSGVLVALAAACKLFPILFFVFFLQRRAWRALLAGTVAGLIFAAISISIFGWNAHWTYLQEVLPWTLHGEGLPPYIVKAGSISSILHYLFLSEPQWNPHPWHNSPLFYALLQPTLPLIVLAPAILFIDRQEQKRERILLEWSALLIAALAISTIPASYNFVLLVLPMCVGSAFLLERKRYGWLAALFLVYLGIGLPLHNPATTMGPAILLYVPRLPLLLALLLGIYLLLANRRSAARALREWPQYAWVFAIVIFALFGVRTTLYRERTVRQEYAYRLPLHTQALLSATPQFVGPDIRYVAFTLTGYHLQETTANIADGPSSSGDDLSFTSGSGRILVEKACNGYSKIVDVQDPRHVVSVNASQPILSSNGKALAFVRDNHGRGSLIIQRNLQSQETSESVLTPPSLNVYEAAFLSETNYAFSAVEGNHPPQIYLTDSLHRNIPINLTDSRYPALSPDGHWMAYSHLENGYWNLWIRNQSTGETRRIADLPCNQIQPSWKDDSKTLLYGTDCGRSLWFTAIASRQVIP